MTDILGGNKNHINGQHTSFSATHILFLLSHWKTEPLGISLLCLERLEESYSASRFEINHRERCQSTVKCGHSSSAVFRSEKFRSPGILTHSLLYRQPNYIKIITFKDKPVAVSPSACSVT